MVALAQLGPASARTYDAVPLVRLSKARLAHCERSGLLRPVCPRLVPRVGAPYLSNLSVELAGRSVLDVFDLERGGELPQHPERNRPPRMGHVVAVAGNVERLAAFEEPHGTVGERVRDGLMRRSRRAPVSFGRVRWAGRVGALYLMPPFPHGGMLGNHLVFSWHERGGAYALSLHAWEPLAESVATLHAMVESLPSPAESGRLFRLSPVRHLTLPRGASVARSRFVAPRGSSRTFDVFVVAPARADIGLRMVTSSGETLHVLGSTRSGECKVRPPLRTCLLHVRSGSAIRSGVWTIVAVKRSLVRAQVRVDVSFR